MVEADLGIMPDGGDYEKALLDVHSLARQLRSETWRLEKEAETND